MMNGENHAVVGCFEGDRLAGVFGLFADAEKHTADCIGPFVEGDDFADKAKEMFLFAKSIFAVSTSFNFFFDKRNTECLALMNVINSEDKGNECILTLKRENFTEREYADNVVKFSSEYRDELLRMHDSIFPDVYVSGNDIVSSIGNSREVFCSVDNGVLLGYSVVKKANGSLAAYVEILGVGEKYRGSGYGKALLNCALKYIFSHKDINAAKLVVENLNINAIRLYDSFGFEVEVENYAFRAC